MREWEGMRERGEVVAMDDGWVGLGTSNVF